MTEHDVLKQVCIYGMIRLGKEVFPSFFCDTLLSYHWFDLALVH